MPVLDRYFERVVIISLVSRPDRRNRCAGHLQSLALTKNPVWFDAIDGKLHPPPRGWNAGPGGWGCHQSHLTVIHQAIQDRLSSVLILEDDVLFCPGTAGSLAAFLNAVPADWAQIYLGGQHLRPPRPASSPLVCTGHDVNRTHAYAVNGTNMESIAAFISQWSRRLRGLPHHIDHHFGMAHRMGLWPAYCPKSWFAGQVDTVSDIDPQQAAFPVRWWQRDCHSLSLPVVAVSPGAELSMTEASLLFFPNDQARRFYSDTVLAARLRELCREAAQLGRLPAWRGSRTEIRRIRRLWHNEVVPLSRAATLLRRQREPDPKTSLP